MSRRSKRINYKEFASTGRRIEVAETAEDIDNIEVLVNNLSLDDNMDKTAQLTRDAVSLQDEIADFLEENIASEQPLDVKVLNDAIQRIENLRSNYRSKHLELQDKTENYEETFKKSYLTTMEMIKAYIMEINHQKRKQRYFEEQIKKNQTETKNKMLIFHIEEVDRMMKETYTTLNINIEDEEDKDLKRQTDGLQTLLKNIRRIGEKIEEMIKLSAEVSIACDVDEFKRRYEKLTTHKDEYTYKLKQEMKKREIDKHETFETSSLNIKLSKFKDYSSAVDVFTFKDLFEKIHLKSTPKVLLPDLLKNNYLEGPAFSLVRHVDDINEIWERLKRAYGDSKMMLTKKLADINQIDGLWKTKDASKTAEGIAKIINCMKDLMRLCKRHNIENSLYYSGTIDRLLKLLGDQRLTRWLANQYDAALEGERLWMKLIEFLEKELKVNQQKSLLLVIPERKSMKDGIKSFHSDHSTLPCCSICGDSDHIPTNGPGNTKLIQYFACKKFAEMSPADRFGVLRKNGLCFQCLYPGAKRNVGKHREGNCQRDFICKHPMHHKYPTKMHILVCEEHKHLPENLEILNNYKQKCILRQPDVPAFSKNIQLSYHSSSDANKYDERAIYMLQPINVNSKLFNIFYDSGCGDFVSRYDAVRKLGKCANKEFDGPIKLGGVGGISTEARHGIYSVRLPLITGKEAMMTGVCLDEITHEFPKYPLNGKVIDDIKQGYKITGGNVDDLPRIPDEVGGKIDFMIGIKYLRYFPETIFQLPSGLTIYRSKFQNPDGSCGIIGGPHMVFTDIERQNHLCKTSKLNFLSNQLQLYRNGFQLNPDVKFLKDSCNDIVLNNDDESTPDIFLSRKMKLFENYEHAGSEIQYRCVNCRDCQNCKVKDGELLSIKEEVEQGIIDRSVKIEGSITVANLPFIQNPSEKLQPNYHKALKVFEQQMKKLTRNTKDKSDVIQSEEKLQRLGHVDYVYNLPPEIQSTLAGSKIQNYIPWRAVWKESSLSTPCRMVFDASQPTGSGYSLNDLLCKGRNNMNKLAEIFIRWRNHKIAFHTDVAKMYNSVKLNAKDWCYQRYLWKDNLNDENKIQQKVIKTLIYGVRSSGNQAETGIRQVAAMSKDQYPQVNDIIQKDIYVDDCLSGEDDEEKAVQLSDQLDIVLGRGGFNLKGITMSGHSPHKDLSVDGRLINVAGLLWDSKADLICLDIKDLNFAKKHRGKKTQIISAIPEKLTRRQCTSKVAEIYDLTGMLTPIVATLKLDLHELVTRKLQWDDVVPDNLRNIWMNNFQMMEEMKHLQFNRAVIPSDAVNLNVSTLAFGDASKSLVCVAIYARYERRNGKYSCQLILAKSRLVPDGMSQPRAELYAALVNVHASEIVKRSLHKYHTNSLHFTDSQIALYWICNSGKTLKQWVRNRVIEIRRYTTADNWRYVQSGDMIADIGTRKGVQLHEVKSNSIWINGHNWMTAEPAKFPAMTINNIKLNSSQIKEAQHESKFDFEAVFIKRYVPDEVKQRYAFSKYVLDPNKFKFSKVVRILAFIMKFIRCLKKSIATISKKQEELDHSAVILTDTDIAKAEHYYFMKATQEVKQFMKADKYKKFSVEKDGILIYSGRILPTDTITVSGRMTLAMKDLAMDMFCVPIIEKHSPLAYSIISEVHWYDSVQHSGIETMWRHVLKKAYVVEGRKIVKSLKKSCERCHYLEKRQLEVAMGPVSTHNLTIAPAFHTSQVDLCGPFEAHSHHHKRTTIKIWMVVFCCATTSATCIKIMENYSASAFIQAFIRFSCTYGYPKLLLSDEGSQLVKGFETMELNFENIKKKLYKDVSVTYEKCPVGGHNMNGKVERQIREIKVSLEKRLNSKLSIMQWETLAAEIGNSINNRPLALGNITSNFENMDLITPNRLLMGRNNERSPVGKMTVTSDPTRIFKSNNAIFDSWFENWLMSHVPKLMLQPKWFQSDDIKEGDIILFLKAESSINSTYQYGLVDSIQQSKDGKIRKVKVKYKNANENTFRYTFRAVRELIVIHHVDEIGVMAELNNMARYDE